MVVLPVPGLEAVNRHDSGVPEQERGVAETVAVSVKLPMRPNTNPARAVAATSVIAIRMIVASTGEIPPFLPLEMRICYVLAGLE
jgi:hypothetical protein